MKNERLGLTLLTSGVVLLATLTACGGGGASGGGSTPPVPSGPSSAPTTSPTTPPSGTPSSKPSTAPSPAPSTAPTVAPSPTPTPSIAGTATIGGSAVANAGVVFSCGCTSQAGTTTTGADGSYTIVQSSPAMPASPNPTYTTVPGRNYIEIITRSGGAQTWNMQFLGSSASTDQGLNSSNTSDVYTTAVTLYAYNYSSLSSGDTSFDLWNFPSLQNFYTSLKTGTPNAAEQKLLNDIVSFQNSNTSLYPETPLWQSMPRNATISSDLVAVHNSGDPALPKQCSSASDSSCPGLSP